MQDCLSSHIGGGEGEAGHKNLEGALPNNPPPPQELPKKHHEEGSPEQLLIDTLDTVKIAKRSACGNEQCKGHFGKFVFQNAPPPLRTHR